VVASEVKALSKLSDHAAKDISEGLQTLKAAIDGSIAAMTTSQVRENRFDMDSVAATINQLGKDMRALMQQEQDIVESSQLESKAVAHIVSELMGVMQFQDLVRQRLGAVRETLGHVVNHMQSLATFIQIGDLGEDKVKSALQSIGAHSKKASDCSKATHLGDVTYKPIELF
jgi:hypothetical protein